MLDERFSRYPPPQITLHDMTDITDIMALDKFVVDTVIRELMEEDIPETELNDTFVQTFPEFASYCWAGPYYSAYGC